MIAGTELDTAAPVLPLRVTPTLVAGAIVVLVIPVAVVKAETDADADRLCESDVDINVLGSGGGKEPPERNEGHKDLSSGSDEDCGERWERMAAASRSWTC